MSRSWGRLASALRQPVGRCHPAPRFRPRRLHERKPNAPQEASRARHHQKRVHEGVPLYAPCLECALDLPPIGRLNPHAERNAADDGSILFEPRTLHEPLENLDHFAPTIHTTPAPIPLTTAAKMAINVPAVFKVFSGRASKTPIRRSCSSPRMQPLVRISSTLPSSAASDSFALL